MSFLTKIMPNTFDAYDYVPSIGASGGILTTWKSSLFEGIHLEATYFALTIVMSLLSTVNRARTLLLSMAMHS